MSELLEQLANYRAHVDRAIDFPAVDRPQPDLIQLLNEEPDEGEVMVIDMSTQEVSDDARRPRWLGPALAAAAAVVLVIFGISLIGGDETLETQPATSADIAEQNAAAADRWPAAATILEYVDAYNDKDLDAVMSFFTEESVIVNDPLQNRAEGRQQTETVGIESIRSGTLRDFAVASDEDPYAISNIVVVGDTVSWDHVWTNSSGQPYCATGHEAIVENGIIIRWDFADTAPCPTE